MPKKKRINRSLRSRERKLHSDKLPPIKIGDQIVVNVTGGRGTSRGPLDGKRARVIAIEPDPHTYGTRLRLFFRSRTCAWVMLSQVTRIEVTGSKQVTEPITSDEWMQASRLPTPDGRACTRTEKALGVTNSFNAGR